MSTQKGEMVVGEEEKPEDVDEGYEISVDASDGRVAKGQYTKGVGHVGISVVEAIDSLGVGAGTGMPITQYLRIVSFNLKFRPMYVRIVQPKIGAA